MFKIPVVYRRHKVLAWQGIARPYCGRSRDGVKTAANAAFHFVDRAP
jgi:hypothetical protein